MLVRVCSCANNCSTDLCSGYYGVHKSHLFSELWGISIGSHVGLTDRTTFNCPTRCCQCVQDVMFGYYSGLNLSTLWCRCTLGFTCQCEVPCAEENNTELRSDPCSYTVGVRWGQQMADWMHQSITRSWSLLFPLLSLYIFPLTGKLCLVAKQNQRSNERFESDVPCQRFVLFKNHTSKTQ